MLQYACWIASPLPNSLAFPTKFPLLFVWLVSFQAAPWEHHVMGACAYNATWALWICDVDFKIMFHVGSNSFWQNHHGGCLLQTQIGGLSMFKLGFMQDNMSFYLQRELMQTHAEQYGISKWINQPKAISVQIWSDIGFLAVFAFSGGSSSFPMLRC